jgi:hypothetical protein
MPVNFFVNGSSFSTLKHIGRLIDGVFNTNIENHMWLSSMPEPPACLEIGINFDSKNGIGAIKIWNYNKSLLESVKGIKDLEVLLNG